MFRIFFLLFISFISSCSSAPKQKNIAVKHQPSVKANKVIVLDPGHGGLDYGAKAQAPYVEEKKLALQTALLTKRYLDRLGYKVILTRQNDVFIPLLRRVKTANPSRASIFVSLHFNSSPNKQAHGIEIFYCDKKNELKRSNSSKNLAQSILNDVIKKTQAKSRGVKKGNYYVIRETKIPAVLVEGGFLTNFMERSKLKQKQYLDVLAKSIAEGIDHYLKKNVPGTN